MDFSNLDWQGILSLVGAIAIALIIRKFYVIILLLGGVLATHYMGYIQLPSQITDLLDGFIQPLLKQIPGAKL